MLATETLEQTLSVPARAEGIEFISLLSPIVKPFCTNAEKPPIKFTPVALAALSRVFAISTQSATVGFSRASTRCEIGVTLIRLFIIVIMVV